MNDTHLNFALNNIRKNWDALVTTKDCLHCDGTGKADDYNACGFCDSDDNA